MNTLSLRINYRPLRIGWCVRTGNFDDLRKVLRLTHTLWGGRFNPIIPIDDDELSKLLINAFRVDALYPASDDQEFKDFIAKYPYIPWPLFHKGLFIEGLNKNMEPLLLDVHHPIRHFYEERTKKQLRLDRKYAYYEWSASDPLCDVLLASFGGFPSQEEVGLDYKMAFCRFLSTEPIFIKDDQSIPDRALEAITVSKLSAYELVPDYRIDRFPGWRYPGFFIGNAKDFFDLIYFWNIRASHVGLIFYDPKYSSRMDDLKKAYNKVLIENPQSDPFDQKQIGGLWSRSYKLEEVRPSFDGNWLLCGASPLHWNGLNLNPPTMHFEEKSVLGSLDDTEERVSVTFQLPPKPFFDDFMYHLQHAVVSVSSLTDIWKPETVTLKPPFIPELNEYYGRECHFEWNKARAEIDGLGIIVGLTDSDLSLRALEHASLIAKTFDVFGMNAEPSYPGLIGARLIQQMGGVQGCSVFKIPGVRELIGSYTPYKAFNKSAAIQKIAQIDSLTGKPNFSNFENLYLEYKPKGKPTPEDAFVYLLKKGVFRVGLNFDCPNCHLEFWAMLDDVKTMARCEYCGNEFNVTPQLKDRDWAYRRSGLFGKDDHQEGGIPVAVTLQQLDTTLHSHLLIFSTGMKITPKTDSISECESDLVLMTQDYQGKAQLLIGECKTHGEITEEDVMNLKLVADAFPEGRIETYIVFSKLSPFSDEEINRCKIAQDRYRSRVIMLSARELEPYFIYERAALEFDIRETAISLNDLAQGTNDIYLNPKPKKVS